MKKIMLILLSFILLSTCSWAQEEESYYPDGLSGVELGMSLKSFVEQNKGMPSKVNDSFDFRKEIILKYEDKDFTQVTYYFDLDGDMPLYEMIIEYPEGVDVSGIATGLYGDANYGSKWKTLTEMDYFVISWVFENKLVIVATLEGTEMAEKGNDDDPVLSQEIQTEKIKEIDGLVDELQNNLDDLGASLDSITNALEQQ